MLKKLEQFIFFVTDSTVIIFHISNAVKLRKIKRKERIYITLGEQLTYSIIHFDITKRSNSALNPK